MKFRIHFSLILSMFGGIACSLKVPHSRMDELGLAIPGTWAASAQARGGMDHSWVKDIGGSGLQQLVNEALGQNKDLMAAASRVERARAQIQINQSNALPQLSLGGEATRQKQNFVGFPGPGGSIQATTYNAAFATQWELDLWGAIRKGSESQLALAQSQEYQRQGAELSLAAQITKLWLMGVEARAQQSLAEEDMTLRRQSLDLLTERFRASLTENGISQSQIYLAKTELAAAQAEISRWQLQDAEAKRQIEMLMGRYAAGNLSLPNALPKLPKSPPAGLPSELLLRRPDILAAERKFASAGRLQEQADRAVFPSISLTGRAGQLSGELGQLMDSNAGVWSLVGGISQPILRGGAIRAEQKGRKADEAAALAELQQVVLKAFYEVELALVTEKNLAARENSLLGASRAAEEAAKSAREGLGRGTDDGLGLIEAQRRRLQFQSQLLQVRRLRLENQVVLHQALGGKFK